MMIFQTTQKAVKNNFSNVLAVSYCEAQHLLRFKRRFAYTANVYGWRADVYDLGAVAIATGYAPFGRDIDHKKLREYDNRAAALINTPNEEQDTNALLKAWILDELNATNTASDASKQFVYLTV